MRRRWKSSWLHTRVATGEVQVSLWLSLPLALLCVGCRSESSAPVTPQSDAATAVGSAAASRIPSPVRTITGVPAGAHIDPKRLPRGVPPKEEYIDGFKVMVLPAVNGSSCGTTKWLRCPRTRRRGAATALSRSDRQPFPHNELTTQPIRFVD
jgi:hypothetical protein